MNNLAEIVDITEELGSQIVRYYTIRMDEEEHNLFELFLLEHMNNDSMEE